MGFNDLSRQRYALASLYRSSFGLTRFRSDLTRLKCTERQPPPTLVRAKWPLQRATLTLRAIASSFHERSFHPSSRRLLQRRTQNDVDL